MPYVDAGGVHTWYAEYGSGKPLRPDLVDRLVLISANFHYDGLLVALDVGELGSSETTTRSRPSTRSRCTAESRPRN
jgi:hypothetical protein